MCYARDQQILMRAPLYLSFYFYVQFGFYTWWISNFSINRLVKHKTNVAEAVAASATTLTAVALLLENNKKFASGSQLEVCCVHHFFVCKRIDMLYWYSSAIYLRLEEFNFVSIETKQTRPQPASQMPPQTHTINRKVISFWKISISMWIAPLTWVKYQKSGPHYLFSFN